jgi:ribosomal protein S9
VSGTMILNRKSTSDYYDPTTWEVFLQAGQVIDQAAHDRLDIHGLLAAEVAQQGGTVLVTEPDRWHAAARYKTGVARVLMRLSEQPIFRVNGQPLASAFIGARTSTREFLHRLLDHGTVADIIADMEVIVHVVGGQAGSDRQARATAHAVARAVAAYDHSLKPILRQLGYWGVNADSVPNADPED